MKNKLFTTLVFFGLSFIAWNCSGDPASPIPNPNPAYNPTDLSSSAIVPVGISSSSIATAPTSSATVTVSSSSITAPLASSSSVAAPASSAQKTQSSSSVANKQSSSSQQQAKSSSAKSTKQCNGQCYDSASDKCVGYHDQQTGPKGEKYAYNESCKLNCYYDPNNKNCESMTASKPASSQSQQSKSSSSKTVTSSTNTSSTSISGTSVELKYISGGKSGKGFASRYWDCCKPHCSWPEHAHGNYSKQCTNKGTKESTDWGGGSVCSGGGLMTCTSQIPIIVNDSLAYAFAAVPAADGGSCGKCYALKFDGKGKYESKINHSKLKGKILVVMATNIGGDVQQGQFDVLIPGGGVGLFNGCASMGWGSQGEQYGGLLSQCEGDSRGLDARKDCLAEKCKKSFANDEKAKEGCMFLATWMQAAGNPTHEYKEVECPAGLKAQY